MARWIEVPEQAARAHPLYGVKGWLVLLAIGLGLAPFRSVALTLADPPTQDVLDQFPWLPGFLQIELGAVMAVGLFSWVLCWALVARKRWFPTGYFVFAAVVLVFPFADAGAAIAAFAAHDVALSFADVLDPRALMVAAPALLWSAYIVNSKRVNVTYRQRLPAA
jgi:hypothetical protein